MDSPSPAPRVVPLPWRRSGSTPTTATPAPQSLPIEEVVRRHVARQLAEVAGQEVARCVALGSNERRRRLIERCIHIGIDFAFWPALGSGILLGLWWGVLAGLALARWGASS